MPITNNCKLAEIMAFSSLLPSPTGISNIATLSTSTTPYDIFLSFRGEDTRKSFTSHLFKALKHQGYSVFHDTLLKRGQLVSSSLLKAIDDSKLSIVVFSKNYADSRWCLDELVKIIECRRSSGQIVLPVFYDVEPSDVRNQTGHYAAAFTNHNEVHEIGPVNKWKAALKEAGNLSGLHLQNDSNGDEANFVHKIVRQVEDSLDQQYLHVADYPVGIESHIQKLNGLLSLQTDDVRIVAIWGLGGIGKTTIAKAMFNNMYRFFEGSCFLADVRETAIQPNGVFRLQEMLISEVLKQHMPKIYNRHHGIEVIKQKLWCRKVFIVLDDVNSISQLKNMAINPAWLPQGSRVIVTTRDRSCLSSLDAIFYEPKPLDASNSLSLFNHYAFGDHSPEEGYEKLLEDVVNYAGGLPLVLETLGSYMRDLGTPDEWQRALERLREIPSDDVQEKLKLSFDSLAVREKELFLDIVGFFLGMDKDFMFHVLAENAPGYFPEFEFKLLLNRCLVKISKDGKLWVHDMLRDMGRIVTHEESFNDPKTRRRVWHRDDMLNILKESSGTEEIESIIMELPDLNKEHVDINVFANMSKVRLIHLRHLNLVGTCNSMQSLDKLRWLAWYGFPLTCIPSNLDMRNLVALDLQKSRLTQLWKGTKVMNKLRFLDVSDSYLLTSTPDFSGVVNLERLWLSDCKNLVEVHPSIRSLHKLVILDLSGCSKLFEAAGFEVSFSNLWHLFSSMLSSKSLLPQSRASNYPSASFVQGLNCLTVLNLNNSNLTHVPVEIGNLASLELLKLSGNKFSSIPESIKNLHRLQTLDVQKCCELKSIAGLPNDLLLIAAKGCQSLETVRFSSDLFREPIIQVSKGVKFVDNIFTNNEQGHAVPKISVYIDGMEKQIPHWLNYQGVGPFISFVAPRHANASIRGWIVGVVLEGPPAGSLDYMLCNVYNKTKNTMHTVFLSFLTDTNLSTTYVEFSKHGIAVEGDDEIEILFTGTAMLDGCGMRLVYDEGEDGEMDEQLMIEYSPYVNLYDDEEENVVYVSHVMMTWVKPMLDDLKDFDEEALLVLANEIVAAGGVHNNEHRQVYHIIANALYTKYVQSSMNQRQSLFLQAIEEDID